MKRPLKEKKRANDKKLILIGDHPAEKDELKYSKYAKLLQEGIIHLKPDSYLTIGVEGDWGCGKTTLMKLIEKELQDHEKSVEQKNTPNSLKRTLKNPLKEHKITIVWFNAWEYSKDEEISRAFLQSILVCLKENSKSKVIRDKAKELLRGIIDRSMIRISTASTGVKFSVKDLRNLLQSETRRPDSLREEFRQLVKDYLKEKQSEEEGSCTLHKRLVVFIDDLDRCLPQRSLEIFETIKLFLDVPKCVFVVGIDKERLEKGLDNIAKNGKLEIDGKSYLEKIFQVHFHIPPIRESEMEGWITKLIEGSDNMEEEQKCAKLLVKATECNPRKIKIFLNSLRILVEVARRKQSDGERPLDARVMTKLFCIKECFKEFYAELEKLARTGTEEKLLKPLEAKAQGKSYLDRADALPGLKPDVRRQKSHLERGGDSKENSTDPLVEKFSHYPKLIEFLREDPLLSEQKLENYIYLCGTESKKTDSKAEEDLLSGSSINLESALREIGEEKALKIFEEKLHSKKPQERKKAALALGEMGAKEFAGDIAELLKDNEWIVRKEAISVLGRMEAKEFAGDIAELLKDNKSEVRDSAALVLGKMGAKEFAGDIAELLNDNVGQVRRSAAFALGDMKAKTYAKDIAELLNDNVGQVRRSAAFALGDIGAKEFAGDIAELLKDKDWIVRESALFALGDMKAKTYAKDIARLLKDSKSGRRMVAILALGRMGSKEFAGDIAELLKDKSSYVRFQAAETLGEMGAKEFAGDIAKLLKDKDWIVKEQAISVLGWMGAKEFAGDIAELLKDNESRVRDSAACTLVKFGRTEGYIYLNHLLETGIYFERHNAAELLGDSGDERALPYLEDAKNDWSVHVQRAAEEAIKQINERAKQKAAEKSAGQKKPAKKAAKPQNAKAKRTKK